MLLLQLFVVLGAIVLGARLGGVGLGVTGGLGVAILTFVFGVQPTTPPIDVMLMIAAVVTAASCMQAAGGLEYMVKIAERILRSHPEKVTILSPIVTYLFTFIAGTGHIAYSVLPVIAEVAKETKIRPERPLGIAVIASQQAITASPISAATVALLGLLSGFDLTLFDILKVSIPATFIGVLAGAFCSLKVGKELTEDPEYLRRLKEGLIKSSRVQTSQVQDTKKARLSVFIFLIATLLIVLFGSIEALRPTFKNKRKSRYFDMPALTEITAFVQQLLFADMPYRRYQGSTRQHFLPVCKRSSPSSALRMGDTFIAGNIGQLTSATPPRFIPCPIGVALFVMSIPFLQSGSTRTCSGSIRIALGISPLMLIALFPRRKRIFLHILNYPTVVAAINFDSTARHELRKIYPEPHSVHDAGTDIYRCSHCSDCC